MNVHFDGWAKVKPMIDGTILFQRLVIWYDPTFKLNEKKWKKIIVNHISSKMSGNHCLVSDISFH